jgi:phosphatidylethanolamine/phosphatidyl-N-methylethanolamine N-methyltransferase
MNGETLSFLDQVFDYVILFHVLAAVDNPEKLLEETYRVLNPNEKAFKLNHFTAQNWLRYIDTTFHMISRLFYFKSIFYIDSLTTIIKFTLFKEISFGKFSYFKLLMYRKA